MAVQRTEQMARKARNIPAHSQGLESKKNSGGRRGIFLDFTFYRTSQDFALVFNNEEMQSDEHNAEINLDLRSTDFIQEVSNYKNSTTEVIYSD